MAGRTPWSNKKEALQREEARRLERLRALEPGDREANEALAMRMMAKLSDDIRAGNHISASDKAKALASIQAL